MSATFPSSFTDGICNIKNPIIKIALPAIINEFVKPIFWAINPVASKPGIDGNSERES